MGKKLILIVGIVFMATLAYAQNMNEISQIASAYGIDISEGGKGTFMGFSVWGIVWGLIFSGVGFVAFSYGKKNSLYIPMGIGIALIVYPYFVQNAWAVFIIGAILSASLYFFRQ